MNFILQDFVEPKVLGDSLHLHPVEESCVCHVDCCHCVSGRVGDYLGTNRSHFCCSFNGVYQDSCSSAGSSLRQGGEGDVI